MEKKYATIFVFAIALCLLATSTVAQSSSGGGGGGVMGDSTCYLNTTQDTCVATDGCRWDMWGQFCHAIGCWDFMDSGACTGNATDLGIACTWQTAGGAGSGWCEDAAGCWNYQDSGACTGASCIWDGNAYCGVIDCWAFNGEYECTNNGCTWDGWSCMDDSAEACWGNHDNASCVADGCDWNSDAWCEMAGCWNHMTSDPCNAAAGCEWMQDEWGGWCMETGGCFAYEDVSSCTNNGCVWDTEHDGCMMLDCWSFEENEANCTTTATAAGLSCSWEEDCHPNDPSDSNCYQYGTENDCTTAGCGWGSCMMQGCWDYSNETDCDGTSSSATDCYWDSQYNSCNEGGCWSYGEADCTSGNGCNWKSDNGWCEDSGCWNYDDNNSCLNDGTGCAWQDGDWGGNCYDVGCWDYSDNTTCLAASGCAWDGSSCYETGCWDYGDNTTCMANSCDWIDTGKCSEGGCWEYSLEGDCTGGGCTWEGGGWCEDTGCWNYNLKNTCDNVEGCAWNEQYSNCEQKSCDTFTTEGQCNLHNSTTSGGIMNCFWDGWSCMELGCWNLNNGGNCTGTVGAALGCSWETQSECKERSCWNWNTEGDCMGDSDCNWTGSCSGDSSLECWNNNNEGDCLTAGCSWDAWCQEKGCWSYETQTACTGSADETEGEQCGWETNGWCKDTGCWDYYNEANCTGTAGCLWDSTSNYCYEEGCWDYNQSTCTLNAYRNCKWGGNVTDGSCYEEGCWNWMTSGECGAHNSSNCVWDTNGDYCYEEGCWSQTDSATCDAQSNCEWENQGWCYTLGCWNSDTQADCIGSVACAWDSTYEYCYDKGCWDYSDNSSCLNNTGCGWDTDGEYCFEAGCWNNYDNNSCLGNSNCFWDESNTAGWCKQGGCWDYFNADDCANVTANGSINCMWDSQWGNCIEQGCWAYQNDTNCDGGTNCNWNTGFGWCFDEGCWDIYEESTCTANSQCEWNSQWDYCYETGCGNKDQGGCEGNSTCQWKEDTWGWCEEQRCWDFGGVDQNACENNATTYGLSCVWDSEWGGNCEEAACWAFDGNQTACEDPAGAANQTYNLTCQYLDDVWCEPAVGNCAQYNGNERACMDTYYCFWDWQLSNCSEPGVFGGQGFAEEMDAFNPECWLFDYSAGACENITFCDYSASSCDPTAGNDGSTVSCENITGKDLCTEIVGLSNCCKWRNGTCKTDYLDKSCHDNMQEPPEGAMFCEDWKSYTNEDKCNDIMGSPWFMPCTWDGEFCTFKFDDVVGTGGDFFDIKTENMCEQAGGEWLCENYCDDNNTAAVTSDDVLKSECWCKVGASKSNCKKSCWACETNGTAAWPSLELAQDACEGSKANCEFTVSSNAANGFGGCDFATTTQTGGGCDKSCTACNDVVDDPQTNDPEKKMACLQSQATCKWAQDLANKSKGKCMGQSGKTCSQSCFACTETECEGYGLDNAGACNWNDQDKFCEPANFDNEICFNEKDDDNDGEIDCNDPDCFFMPECAEGEGMHECWKFLNESTCIPGWGNLTADYEINCTWTQDPWGASWCGHPAESCWQLDNNPTGCDAQDGCRYKSNGGFCDINKTVADSCFGKAQAGCLGDCTWITDYNNPKGGFCEFKMFALCHNFDITSQSECESTTNKQYCGWKQDQYAPNGGWCEPKCFTLDNTSCAANIKCDWLAGFCEPDMTRGEDCFDYDNDASGCAAQPACMWHMPEFAGGGECEAQDGGNFTPTDCMNTYWNSGECNADANCYWMEDQYMGGGFCDNKAFACAEMAFQALEQYGFNQTGLDIANATCAAANSSGCVWTDQGGPMDVGWCEHACMYNATMFEMSGGSQGEQCGSMESCQSFTGWCDPKAAGQMMMGMDSPPADIGFDVCPESGKEQYHDICGMGVKDDFDMLGIGVGLFNLSDAAVCNGQYIVDMSSMFMGGEASMEEGTGEQPMKLAFYLDSDGIDSGGCSAGSTQVGYEFKIVFSSTMAEKAKVTPYKCVTNSWETTSTVQANTLANVICSKANGPLVMINKGDLIDTGLFDMSYDLRILAVMMNVTSGTTIDSVSGVYTPGALDFMKEDCMGFSDMDGDGLLPDQDPDCKFIKQFGGMLFEDCYNGIDDDQDGLADCNDQKCSFLPICGGNIFDYTADADDTTMASISTYDVQTFVDAAFVTYTSNEPANGTLTFYETSAGCSVINATIYDLGIVDSNVPTYRQHHDAPLDFQTLGYDLTNNMTYFFKLKVCDKAENPCAESACINFTTEYDMTSCGVNCEPVFDVKFTPPEGDNFLSGVDVQWDFGQGFQAKGCGGAAAVKKNYSQTQNLSLKIGNDNASWNMQMGGIDVQGQIDTNKTNIDSDELYANTSGGNSYVGMDRDRWDDIKEELSPEYIDICVPGQHTRLYHCDNESAVTVSDCTDVTSMVISGPTYNSSLQCTLFRVPSGLGFSVYFGYTVAGDDDDDDDSGGGGGGGGGGAVVVSNSTSKKWTTIAEGVEQRMKVYSDEFGIEEIYFTTNAVVSNVQLKVTNLGTGKPTDVISGPGGEIYRYFDLTKSMVDDEEITGVKMRFHVEQAWLDALGTTANVRLYRYSQNRWVDLSTVYTDSDGTYYYFNATSPGMSYFAIGLTADAVAPVEPTEEPTEEPTTEPLEDPTAEVVTPDAVEPGEEESGTSLIMVLLVCMLVILVIAGAGYFYWTKHGEEK